MTPDGRCTAAFGAYRCALEYGHDGPHETERARQRCAIANGWLGRCYLQEGHTGDHEFEGEAVVIDKSNSKGQCACDESRALRESMRVAADVFESMLKNIGPNEVTRARNALQVAATRLRTAANG